MVHLCEYDEGRVEPLVIQVRSFGATTMLVTGDTPGARDYIAGEFRSADPSDAAQWFET